MSRAIQLRAPKRRRSAIEEELWLLIIAHKVGIPEREYRFHPERLWRFDFAWPELMAVVEVEGLGAAIAGRHQRVAGFDADCEKYCEAAVLGWTVLRVTGKQVKDCRAIEWIKKLLALRTAERTERRSPMTQERR